MTAESLAMKWTAVPESPGVPDPTTTNASQEIVTARCIEERCIEERFKELELLTAELNRLDGYEVDEKLPFAVPTDFCLSIVIPVFNESTTIQRILARVRSLPLRKEIIVVDDGSQDGTRDLLKTFADLPDLRVLLQPKNQGKGAAVRTGLQAARGNIVVVQDADLEYDPRDILTLLEPILLGDVDVVYGSRFLNDTFYKNSSPVHRWGNRMLTVLSNCCTGLRLTDMETCYKVIRRDKLDGIALRQDRFGFEPEITAKLARKGCRIAELPVHYEARDWSDGKKIGVWDGIKAVYCILRYAMCD
ncbi:MAG: glycosyltransferase family 2 protein [Planctomycetota bacterium]|nr:glycosyltransferase family 2 protein [Planctomycetota bacterium]